MASKQRKRRRKRRAVKKAPPLPPVSAQAEEEKARTRGRRYAKGWRACLFGIGLLCALWTALAVSLPPTVLRGVVESQLSEAVNAPVTIESLSVNPFTLGIAVRGVRVPYLEETGTPDGALLTIERLDPWRACLRVRDVRRAARRVGGPHAMARSGRTVRPHRLPRRSLRHTGIQAPSHRNRCLRRR